MIDLKDKNIVFCGDIHGEFKELVNKITVHLDLKDTAVIVCGDCGFGFEKPKYYTETIYRSIIKRLNTNNNELIFIRGNHDNPEYFNGDKKINLPRFRTVEDYEILETKRGNFLCIGGATSIDKEIRLKWETSKNNKKNKKTWWENERPIKKELKELPIEIFGVISHDCPIQIGPIITRGNEQSLETYQNTIKDRDYLGKVLINIKPKYWFFGHHHTTLSGSWGDTLWYCLNIMELFDFKQ